MIKNLTLTQKMFIALSLPLIIVIINSLMAVIQLQNYQRMIKYEIVNIQESDSIKDDLGKILEKYDKKAKVTILTIILVSIISVIMVVIMAVLISRNLEFQYESGKGMTGT